MTNAHLSELLARHGLVAVEIPGTDGGVLLALNAGARTLRLMGQSGHDFLWINEALLDGRMVEEDAANGWRNFGGDRTWIGPESDLFISDLGDPWHTYRMPRSFDPGRYEVSKAGSGVRMSSRCVVMNHRLNAEAELSVEKTITTIPNPLRISNAGQSLMSAEYIGYDHTTTLCLLSKPPPRPQAPARSLPAPASSTADTGVSCHPFAVKTGTTHIKRALSIPGLSNHRSGIEVRRWDCRFLSLWQEDPFDRDLPFDSCVPCILRVRDGLLPRLARYARESGIDGLSGGL